MQSARGCRSEIALAKQTLGNVSHLGSGPACGSVDLERNKSAMGFAAEISA
jgi:hypothetical protein